MRISNIIRFVEDKSLVAARGISAAVGTLSADIKVEYQARQLARAVERVEIQARALEMYEQRVAQKEATAKKAKKAKRHA